MEVSKNVHLFTTACEHLLASITMHRPLTQEEALLVKHYCDEVVRKIGFSDESR